MPYSGNNLKDLSLFLLLFSVVAMTVLSSYSNNKVGGEHNFNARAQVMENPQQQPLSSLTTPPQTGTMPAIKITSHSNGQQVKAGPLTISGTSSDTTSTNCEVYADWNDNMPFGKAVAAGPGGPDDYSKWVFTYSSGYHMIQNGTNNLTSKISCVDGPTSLAKWYSINLIGVDGLPSTDSTINQAITAGLAPTSPSPPVLPLPTPSQVVGELNEEDDESNENDDSDSDDNNEGNEEDNNEEDENSSGSEDEDSGDSRDEENGGAGDNGGDDDDGDNAGDGGDGADGADGSDGGNGGGGEVDIPSLFN